MRPGASPQSRGYIYTGPGEVSSLVTDPPRDPGDPPHIYIYTKSNRSFTSVQMCHTHTGPVTPPLGGFDFFFRTPSFLDAGMKFLAVFWILFGVNCWVIIVFFFLSGWVETNKRERTTRWHLPRRLVCPLPFQGAKMTSEPWQFTNRVMQSQVCSSLRDEPPAWCNANVFYDVSNISPKYLEMRHSIHLTRGKTRHLNSFGGFRVLDSWTDTVAFCSGPSIQEKASIQWPVYWSWSLKLSATTSHLPPRSCCCCCRFCCCSCWSCSRCWCWFTSSVCFW